MALFKFFSKKNSAKQKNLYNINPDEFIMISEHLMNTSSTTHQLLGIIMASGIPLPPFKKFEYQNSLQFQI
ncbi:hypothetical protein QIA34_05030 (plasmid) [Borreliella yangtzensis]|uniref:Uncharacterized protein n=1 Tax=Borreliella yangtzensis TaxID=683292 RepID=A0ABR6PBB3_9SPIR|nr:hypothetical protein [Borreliella yangtzensis]